MKYITVFFSLVLFLICQSPGLIAQEKKQAVNIEGLGTGMVYSIGYERVLYNYKKYTLNGRVGVGVFKFMYHMTAPIELINGYGTKRRLEFGLGYSPFLSLREVFNPHPEGTFEYSHIIPLRLGYAYYPENTPLMFRVGMSPFMMIQTDTDRVFYEMWGYLSIGYRF